MMDIDLTKYELVEVAGMGDPQIGDVFDFGGWMGRLTAHVADIYAFRRLRADGREGVGIVDFSSNLISHMLFDLRGQKVYRKKPEPPKPVVIGARIGDYGAIIFDPQIGALIHRAAEWHSRRVKVTIEAVEEDGK